MRVIEFFDSGVRLYPNNIAFVDAGGEMTYAQADVGVHRIAAAIRGRGYGKASHIGILAPNSTIAFIGLLGVFRAEGVWLPINPRNPVLVNSDLLCRFDCELLLYHSDYSEEAKLLIENAPNIREAVCLDSDGLGVSMKEWGAACGDFWELGEAEPHDLFAIFPTGGTTGKSKGVMISNKNIECLFAHMWSHFSYYDNTNHLVVAPMTHTAGIFGCLHFARGGTNTIMSSVEPDKILEMIHLHKITHLFLPPTVLYMMLASASREKYSYRSLKHFFLAAAPTSFSKLKEAIEVFGPVMSEVFGQSEAPATVTLKAPWDYLDERGNIIESRLSSVGRPGVFNQVAILDESGSEVSRNKPGEICIKGDLVTPGYYMNKEATDEVRSFGWHHTGDIGVMDNDGYIKIVDRMKDMIITGGFNVFPNEIEQVISQHPSVQECAVIGVPDDKWGEAVKAIVLLKKNQDASSEEITKLVKEMLGSVKAPKTVDFVDELPRSPVGKILKTNLRKKYWNGEKSSLV